MGATARKTTRIVLDPMVIEGKVPTSSPAAALPWKWIIAGGGLLGLYLMAKHAGKGRRGPLGVARG